MREEQYQLDSLMNGGGSIKASSGSSSVLPLDDINFLKEKLIYGDAFESFIKILHEAVEKTRGISLPEFLKELVKQFREEGYVSPRFFAEQVLKNCLNSENSSEALQNKKDHIEEILEYKFMPDELAEFVNREVGTLVISFNHLWGLATGKPVTLIATDACNMTSATEVLGREETDNLYFSFFHLLRNSLLKLTSEIDFARVGGDEGNIAIRGVPYDVVETHRFNDTHPTSIEAMFRWGTSEIKPSKKGGSNGYYIMAVTHTLGANFNHHSSSAQIAEMLSLQKKIEGASLHGNFNFLGEDSENEITNIAKRLKRTEAKLLERVKKTHESYRNLKKELNGQDNGLKALLEIRDQHVQHVKKIEQKKYRLIQNSLDVDLSKTPQDQLGLLCDPTDYVSYTETGSSDFQTFKALQDIYRNDDPKTEAKLGLSRIVVEKIMNDKLLLKHMDAIREEKYIQSDEREPFHLGYIVRVDLHNIGFVNKYFGESCGDKILRHGSNVIWDALEDDRSKKHFYRTGTSFVTFLLEEEEGENHHLFLRFKEKVENGVKEQINEEDPEQYFGVAPILTDIPSDSLKIDRPVNGKNQMIFEKYSKIARLPNIKEGYNLTGIPVTIVFMSLSEEMLKKGCGQPILRDLAKMAKDDYAAAQTIEVRSQNSRPESHSVKFMRHVRAFSKA